MTAGVLQQDQPAVETLLAGLKPFQRATVRHAFKRLWLDTDRVNRFLVADEVGLGKTLVAKGVAALLIDRLKSAGKPATIVYICSNSQIARQNLKRLRELTGGETQDHADRLTLLPKTMGSTSKERPNVISFTPGTSFRLGAATGKAEERILLHFMLRDIVDDEILNRASAVRYFACTSGLENFQYRLSALSGRPELDPDLLVNFKEYLCTTPGPFDKTLREDLLAELAAWEGSVSHSFEMDRRRRHMIGALRIAMAQVAVSSLSADLVILDEFQRFKDLFAAQGTDEQSLNDAQLLAQRIISNEATKSLILSATPYKMFTLPDEVSGEDHHRDFHATVGFLAGTEHAERVAELLSQIRKGMLQATTEGREAAERATATVSVELGRIMSRTERLGSSAQRDGMLAEKQLPPLRLQQQDLRVWMASDSIVRHVDGRDAFEYWRSASYPLNFMERSSYQIANRFLMAAESDSAQMAELLDAHREGLLSWEDICNYRRVDPGNPKMRALMADTLDRGIWRLAWLPPALPYTQPAGPFAQQELQTFTKRLVFSAWSVVPKSIAAMLSYETERRLMEHTGALRTKGAARYDARRPSPVIRFGWDAQRQRPANLTSLTLLHPSVALARLGDPLEVAQSLGESLPLDPARLLAVVTARIQQKLDALNLPVGGAAGSATGRAWYGVAPYLLDREFMLDDPGLLRTFNAYGATDDSASRLADHVDFAIDPQLSQLGPVPEDLAQVLALVAVAGPGVCALRAIGRVTGGRPIWTQKAVRAAALRVSRSLVSLFNRPEITAAVRGTESQPADGEAHSFYWQQVLRYCMEGNLQSVLDEYVHTLNESLGFASESPAERAMSLAEQLAAVATIRTTENTVHDVQCRGGHSYIQQGRINSHIAARFGQARASDAAEARASSVRDSFNSPFWPFVLASTSVGQEGLDFHTYSHSVVHWNLPSNPVDLEQREGRVHRYKGHAIRKNVAAVHGAAALEGTMDDPWEAIFAAAEAAEPPQSSGIRPYWVFEGAASIERYVPAMPLSRETQQYRRLKRTLGAYRSVMGQPRQDDLIQLMGTETDWPIIDLTPNPGQH